MLQIALAPAPVAHREIDEGGRAFLIAARKVGEHIDRPAAAPDEGRLDEVVAENMPAERRLAGQGRHAGMARKGAHADDGVVPPVIAVLAAPGRKAGGHDRAVEAGSELLQPREQGVAVQDQGEGLDDAGARIGLHGARQAKDTLARHEAIGVEHDHMLIGAAPARDEIGDIAGLAPGILRPVSVEDTG